jgi:hypothetical protein
MAHSLTHSAHAIPANCISDLDTWLECPPSLARRANSARLAGRSRGSASGELE